MSDLRESFDAFAKEVAPICSHISVRSDENGPYMFALGLLSPPLLTQLGQERSYSRESCQGGAMGSSRPPRDIRPLYWPAPKGTLLFLSWSSVLGSNQREGLIGS
jgi:hypothetical protein